MNKSVLLVLAGQPFLLGQAVKIACSQEQPEAKFSSTEMKAGERAMDERAMDAAMNPREERHRDEYLFISFGVLKIFNLMKYL